MIYQHLLNISYENVSKIWGYQKIRYIQNEYALAIQAGITLAFIPFFKRAFDANSISSTVVSILILVSMLPTISLAVNGGGGGELNFLILSLLYWLTFLTTFYITRSQLFPNFRIARVRLLEKFIVWLVISSVFFVSITYTGFRLHVGVWDVYGLRLEAREYDMPIIVAYLLSSANYLLPIVMINEIQKGNKLFPAFISFVIFLNFGIAGAKSVMLLLFVSLFCYLFPLFTRNPYRLLISLTSALVIAICEFEYFHSTVFNFFLTFRTIFLPAHIHTIYYDFFSRNEFKPFSKCAGN